MRLLIVEDDAELALGLGRALGRRGIASDHAEGIEDALQMLRAAQYAAILLDLGLGDGDGMTLVRQVRAQASPIPIIAITARSQLQDRIDGLNAGADDYVIKPFDVDELVARLNAVCRRQGNLAGARLDYGNASFDLSSGDLFVGGQHVILSARERELAELLFRRAGQVVSKRLAEDQLFGLRDPVGSNAVEVYAHRLRRKLDSADSTIRIETVRGVGYLLRCVA